MLQTWASRTSASRLAVGSPLARRRSVASKRASPRSTMGRGYPRRGSVAPERITVTTRAAVDTVDVTERIARAVRGSGIAEGICVVAVLHTTAGVFVNENADPDVQRDLIAALAR